MKSLLSVLTSKHLFLTAVAWGWLEITVLPKPMMLFCLFGSMVLDFITGLLLSWKRGQATNYDGLQKTVFKLGRYGGVAGGVWLLALLADQMDSANVDYSPLVNGSLGFMTFVELYSCFCNIYDTSPTSLLSRYFIGPLLKYLRARIEKNPISELKKLSQHDTESTSLPEHGSTSGSAGDVN